MIKTNNPIRHFYLRVGSCGVPSPSHVSKSQHGGKAPTFQPQETNKIWFIFIKVGIWLFYAKKLKLILSTGSWFFLDPTLITCPKSYLQKVLPCRHSCHIWDLRLGSPCEMINPNFHALNGWDCMNWSQVIWDLGSRVNQPLYVFWIHIESISSITSGFGSWGHQLCL